MARTATAARAAQQQVWHQARDGTRCKSVRVQRQN
ncbi:protein of unknown function [Desulfovibrio sp. 86]|nr:protein of unknown function [Desulfovibrio sp. 86]